MVVWLLLEKMTVAGLGGNGGVGFEVLIAVVVVVELADFAVAATVVASVPAAVEFVVAVSAGLAVFEEVECVVVSVFQLAVVVLTVEVVVVVAVAVDLVGFGLV